MSENENSNENPEQGNAEQIDVEQGETTQENAEHHESVISKVIHKVDDELHREAEVISKVAHKIGDEIHKDVDIIKHKISDELHREAEVISKVAHKVEDEIAHDIDVIVEGGEHLDEMVDEYHHDHPVKYNLILWVVGFIAFCVVATLLFNFYY